MPGVSVILARDKQLLGDQRRSNVDAVGKACALKLDSEAHHAPLGTYQRAQDKDDADSQQYNGSFG